MRWIQRLEDPASLHCAIISTHHGSGAPVVSEEEGINFANKHAMLYFSCASHDTTEAREGTAALFCRLATSVRADFLMEQAAELEKASMKKELGKDPRGVCMI